MDTNKMKAIIQLRKTVYLLSETLDGDILYILKSGLNINHIDLPGQTNKEKTISLFIYSQHNGLLNELFSCILNISKLSPIVTFIDANLDVQASLQDVNIRLLSFSINENSTCETEEGKFEHDYYKVRYGCEIFTVCKICGSIANIEEQHVWDNWGYKSPKSCIMRRICRRCHKEEEKQKPEHKWGEWHYINENSCDMERLCTHCQEKEKQIEQHDWSDWMNNGHGHKYKYCSHCHKEEYNIEGHWKGTVEWDNGYRDSWDVQINKKRYLFVFDKLIADIIITTKIGGKIYIIKQRSKVIVDGNICHFKTKDKDVIVPPGILWNKDEFEGKITGQALSIEGKVNSNGKLILL